MPIVHNTRFTASCEDGRCRWTLTVSRKKDAERNLEEHHRWHSLKVGDRVKVEGSFVKVGKIKVIWYDQGEAIVERDPRQEIICYQCPAHHEHGTGQFVSDRVKLEKVKK